MNALLITVAALKEIQYTYSGAGQSYEDLCRIKAITEKALKKLGLFDMSLDEFQKRQSHVTEPYHTHQIKP